jgi:hypothetical protein
MPDNPQETSGAESVGMNPLCYTAPSPGRSRFPQAPDGRNFRKLQGNG